MLAETEVVAAHRKPVLALMGEFSAGKSTLANLLIGREYLPVQVVATRLPPVWIKHGDNPPFRVDLDGETHPIDLERLTDVPLDQTAYIGLSCEEEILEQCDLIDMPGISDPNMSSDVWQRVLPQADAVLWCTHATQAWRQSEAAVWATMPPELYRHSLLLVTRIDKLVTEKDRRKVLGRLRRETSGLFNDCLPISLLQATQVEDDYDKWAESGAEAFARKLVENLHDLAQELNASGNETRAALPSGAVFRNQPTPPKTEPEEQPEKICPRRVARSGSGTRRVRPAAGTIVHRL